ncbi:MAG: metal-dependent transcriptional regulator [Phycisphaerae bacterium]
MSELTVADLSPAQQDYLEEILQQVESSRVARVSAIAKSLAVGKPAVTSALKTLAAKDLVHYEAYQFITLTDAGRRIAREITRRHEVLARFFQEVLGVDAESAEANACRIEHQVDRWVLDRIAHLTRFVAGQDAAGADWPGRLIDSYSPAPATKEPAHGAD